MQVAHRTSGASKACTRRTQQPFQGRQATIVKAHQGESIARREILAAPLLLSGLAALAPMAKADEAAVEAVEAPVAPPAPAFAGKFETLYDETLAYKFDYPVTDAKGTPLRMVLSHPPEKYSSAAPLTADARQRIVGELMDLRNFVTVSITVGPASGVLKDIPQEKWKAREVALTVLVDRSTSRLTSGQRTALNDVEESHIETRDGQPYYVYEHLSQGSPTLLESGRKETYRHALAATTVRKGGDGVNYLYTYNLACRQEQWNDLQPMFKRAIDSFRLTAPTQNFVSPEVNPWQFW